MFIDKHTNSIHTYIDRLYQEDSPEVGPIEILRLFFWPKKGHTRGMFWAPEKKPTEMALEQ